MMINPFVICSVEEQMVARAYADRERWEYECRALGATLDHIRAYDMDAWRYATTTLYPNDVVINYARKVAREALARGESMPASAEQAIRDAEMRELAKLIDGYNAPR